MRNDDIDGDLPRIRATDDDRVTERPGAAEPPVVRAVREPTPRRQRNGALWAVCLSLLIALVGLGYWSHQQQSRLQRQLVATQESFARISEEAAGRLQDISGKVIATESNLSQGEQSRAQQLSQLEQKVEQLAAIQQTQQEALQEQQQRLQQAMETHTQRLTTLDGLAGTLGEQVERQQQSLTELTQQVESTSEAQAGLRNDLTQASERLQGLAELERQLEEQGTQLARQRGELQALLQASSGTSVEQEMLVLRSEIDQRLASTEDSLRAIDSFRLQANRNISTLQSQLSNLQRQMNQR